MPSILCITQVSLELPFFSFFGPLPFHELEIIQCFIKSLWKKSFEEIQLISPKVDILPSLEAHTLLSKVLVLDCLARKQRGIFLFLNLDHFSIFEASIFWERLIIFSILMDHLLNVLGIFLPRYQSLQTLHEVWKKHRKFCVLYAESSAA